MDLVDKLFHVLYKFLAEDKDQLGKIEGLLWDNYEGLRRSLVLLPKITLSKFMRGELRDTVKESLEAVEVLIRGKYEAERRKIEEEEVKMGAGGAGTGNNAPGMTTSIFNLVFSYFKEGMTETENALEKNRKAEANELAAIDEI